MRYDQSPQRWMGIAGMVGGAAMIIISLLQGDHFGYPGSADYRLYEIYNRLYSICLLLASFAFVGIYQLFQNSLPRSGKVFYTLTLISLIGMVVGSAAEFWLFSDLPYGSTNMRSISFGLFALATLLLGIVSLVAGVVFWLKQAVPRSAALWLAAYLPLVLIISSFGPGFVAIGLTATALGYMVLSNVQGDILGK